METKQTIPVESTDKNHWHVLGYEDLSLQLKTSTEKGLSSHDADKRLQSVGLNQLAEAEPVKFWQMVWEQLNNFVIYLLLGASVISALLGDYIEAVVILAIVVLNTILGVVQERRAEQALSALQKMAAPEAHVIRDGHRQIIPASRLVPGDLVLLDAGNFVPADIRMIETINLQIDESALTGESSPAHKDSSIHLWQDIPLGDQKKYCLYGHSSQLWSWKGDRSQHGDANSDWNDCADAAIDRQRTDPIAASIGTTGEGTGHCLYCDLCIRIPGGLDTGTCTAGYVHDSNRFGHSCGSRGVARSGDYQFSPGYA